MTRSDRVRELVDEVIEQLPRPLGEHIILEVFKAIESNPEWLVRYRAILFDEYDWRRGAMNSWAGRCVARSVGGRRVNLRWACGETTLLVSYSTLRF